jgi:glycosyltransferase involved in cell wall biosynthesis
MSAKTLLLSVFIPAFNAENYVREAVESALDNGCTDLEVVVVDDGSTDNTAAIVESIRHPALRLLRNPANLGIAVTRQQSVAHLHGRHMALLDADDIALPGRFASQVDRLESTDGPDIIGGAIECFGDATGTVAFFTTDAQIRASLLFNTSLANPAVTMKLAPLREGLIRYAPDVGVAEDYALWVDAMRAGLRFENLAAPVTRYRRHRDSLTATLSFDEIGAQNIVVRQRVAATYFPGFTGAERTALVDAISRNLTGGQRWVDSVCALAHAAALAPEVPRIDAAVMLRMLEQILLRMIERALAQSGINYDTLEMLSDTQPHFERWRAADNGALDVRIMALLK